MAQRQNLEMESGAGPDDTAKHRKQGNQDGRHREESLFGTVHKFNTVNTYGVSGTHRAELPSIHPQLDCTKPAHRRLCPDCLAQKRRLGFGERQPRNCSKSRDVPLHEGLDVGADGFLYEFGAVQASRTDDRAKHIEGDIGLLTQCQTQRCMRADDSAEHRGPL